MIKAECRLCEFVGKVNLRPAKAWKRFKRWRIDIPKTVRDFFKYKNNDMESLAMAAI